MFTTASPGLRGIVGVSVLRQHARIGTPFSLAIFSHGIWLKLLQSLFKLGFFRGYPARQNSGDFRVQSPQLIDGNRFKVLGSHIFISLKNWGGAARSRPGRSAL